MKFSFDNLNKINNPFDVAVVVLVTIVALLSPLIAVLVLEDARYFLIYLVVAVLRAVYLLKD